MNALEKRHGGTHHANDHYGTFLLYFQIAYIAVVLVLVKKFASLKKISGFGNSRSSNSKVQNLLNRLYSLDPLVHMLMILVIIFIPFPTSKFGEYIKSHYTVYFKKFGKISYCMLLLNLYLVLPRSNTFMIMSYLDSIRFHIWLSRFLLLCAILHSVMFLIRWALQGVLIQKLCKTKYFIGLIIFVWTCVLFGITSIFPGFRRKNYRLFYLIHQITMFLYVVLTIFHADPQVLVPFGILNCVSLLIFVTNRFINYEIVKIVEKSTVNGSQLGYYEIASATQNDQQVLGKQYILPGSHLRLHSYSPYHWKHWFYPSHPFTIVGHSTSNRAKHANSQSVSLVVKQSSANLQNMLHQNKTFYTCGVYPPSKDVQELVNSFEPSTSNENEINRPISRKKLVFVVGGSGFSFAFALYLHVLKATISNTSAIPFVKFNWIVRSAKDLHVLEHFNELDFLEKNDKEASLGNGKNYPDMEVFITNNTVTELGAASPERSLETTPSTMINTSDFDDNENEGFEMGDASDFNASVNIHSLPKYLALQTNDGNLVTVKVNYHVNKRFNVPLDLTENLDFIAPDEGAFTNGLEFPDSEQPTEKWLCCCGPESLIEDGQNFSKRHSDIIYVKEEYQF
ncbi:hypothetical protein ACO0RG_004593 [Hanseniaspora osmophila]